MDGKSRIRGYLNAMKKMSIREIRRPDDRRARAKRRKIARASRATYARGRAFPSTPRAPREVTPRVRIFYLFAPFGVVADAGVIEELPPGVAQGGIAVETRARRATRVDACERARARDLARDERERATALWGRGWRERVDGTCECER